MSYLSTTAQVKVWFGPITLQAEQSQSCHATRKKTGLQNFPARSSSHWHCAKNLDTPQETKMITQGWVREGKGYRKTNPFGPMYERTVGVVGWGNGSGWGIIELQWPYDRTIGEVMCWINSVPDPVFSRAEPLGCPQDPKAEKWWRIFLCGFFQPKRSFRLTARHKGQWSFAVCTVHLFLVQMLKLYILGHALNKQLFRFAGILYILL